MSGWIKVDKGLTETIRFKRVVRKLRDSSNALRGVTQFSEAFAVTLVLGALVRFWIYADSHIRDDDTLDITLDEINEIVGVDGFAQALPAEWLKVIDTERVQLPDFLDHNGSSEKQRRDNARRQAAYRHKHHSRNVTRDVTASNASNDARPDKTRPDKTRPEEKDTAAAPPRRASKSEDAWFAEFRMVYPKRSGDQGWGKALRAANARIAEGHTPEEIISGATRYLGYCQATQRVGSEFVKQAATFLGPDKPFLERWTPPATKAEAMQDANIAASREWLESSNAAN